MLCKLADEYGQRHGEDDIRVLDVKQSLARAYQRQKKFDRAHDLLSEILPKLATRMGKTHMEVLIIRAELADVSAHRGDHESALRMLYKTHEFAHKEFGNEHPLTLNFLYTIGLILGEQGYHKKSEEILKRCLEVRKRKFSDDPYRMIANSKDVSRVLISQRKWTETETFVKEELDLRRVQFPKDHAGHRECTVRLAECRSAQGDFVTAEVLYRQVLEELQDEWPNPVLIVRETQYRLQAALRGQQRYDEADSLKHNNPRPSFCRGREISTTEATTCQTLQWTTRAGALGYTHHTAGISK